MEVYYSWSSSFEEADVRSVKDHVVRYLPIGYVILENLSTLKGEID
jgi:hypothetical protein